MFGKCTIRQISLSVIVFIIISICKPLVTVLICGSVGLPAPSEPKGAAIWYNYARRFMWLTVWVSFTFEFEFPSLLMKLCFFYGLFFSFFVRGDRREKVDSHTHKWSVGKSSALITTRTPVLLRASAVTYLLSKFPARKFKWNSPGIIQHWP